jgi:hypothetical protein
MADPKKGLALMILEHAKKKGSASPPAAQPDGDEEPDGDEDMAGLESAAEDLIDAVRSGDARAVAQAFRSMKELC